MVRSVPACLRASAVLLLSAFLPAVPQAPLRADPAAALREAFEPHRLTRGEARFLEAGLALENFCHGLLDGFWGEGSQRALERFAAAVDLPLPVTGLSPVLLAALTAESFAEDGWQRDYFEAMDLSFMVPAAKIRRGTATRGVVNLGHADSSLAYSLARGGAEQVAQMHAHAELQAAPGEPFRLRRDGRWITSGITAEGSAIHVRSEVRRGRAQLVRVLRAEGMTPMDRETGATLAAMARARAFEVGGVLVGTAAFRLYEGELGLTFASEDLAQTQDIDVASFERLSLAIGDAAEPGMVAALGALDFAPVPSLDPHRCWRLKHMRGDMAVEFITPSFREEEDLRDLPALGVSAQSLHFLNFLIADPVHAAALYQGGVLVRIPRPEAFAIHKLIVADRRRRDPDGRLKRGKDLAQATRLIKVLADDQPELLGETLADARHRGPSWRAHLDAS
ncbi:GSU2403 family nucleotidyltransferase fold protein, partial [Mangrovicoccus ximenensis]|uniref:GSU2403 family nucleotidyltransferase fold protein n=1 Tax=Mangrovicoccus ximenensis TaxID=1911570 RepID=UPI000D358DF4